MKKSSHVTILDSTLRDGMQSEGVAFSLADKLKIVEALDNLGVEIIEAGNPASNPKDSELFRQIVKMPSIKAKICAFGSTRRKASQAAQDINLKTLAGCGANTFCIFGKSALSHVYTVLGASPEENLEMIVDSLEFLRPKAEFLIFDAEHFFDAYKEDALYSLSTLRAAVGAGADVISLCDTNGASYTTDVYNTVKAVCSEFPGITIGIHCHDDCGLAVANSMAAIEAGARHLQGTFLGFGERCGNACLSTLIPNLQIKRGYDCIDNSKLNLITHTAHKIAGVANYSLLSSMPYVGRSAFAHKGGMHIDAVTKLPRTFEHIPPECVGNKRRLLLSEVAGRSLLVDKIRAVEPSLMKDSAKTEEIITKLKEMEYKGYQFEAAEESFELVIRRTLGIQPRFFDLEMYRILGERPLQGRQYPSSAMVKVRVGNETEITAAEGDGPVHALDLALRKALSRFYPEIAQVSLVDYKVRVLGSGTAAVVRVMIESTDTTTKWSTTGVSADVVEASFLALRDSIEYKLNKTVKV